MTRLDLHQSFYRLSIVLASGNAPQYWQRNLTGAIARWHRFWYAGNWVSGVTSIDLRLTSQSLFGDCFNAISNSEAHSFESDLTTATRLNRTVESQSIKSHVETSRAQAQTPKKRTSRLPFTPRLKAAADQNQLNFQSDQVQQLDQVQQSDQIQRSRQTWQHASHLQRQVNAEVLSRLTRQTVNVQFNSVRRHPIAALLRSSRPDREKHPFSTHQIPDKPNSLVQQQWLHRLSQRIQHSIEFPLLHRVNWQPSEPFQLVEKDQIQPWATPLNGKTVSTELLLQLVNGKTSQPSSSAQPTKRDRPGVTSPTSVLRSLNIPQIQASQPRQILAPNAPTTSRTQPSMSSPVAIEPGEAIEAIVPEFRSHSYKLLQSESINTTATRPEEAQPNSIQTMESDLNILATNIKRILDEEARRYGIDV